MSWLGPPIWMEAVGRVSRHLDVSGHLLGQCGRVEANKIAEELAKLPRSARRFRPGSQWYLRTAAVPSATADVVAQAKSEVPEEIVPLLIGAQIIWEDFDDCCA